MKLILQAVSGNAALLGDAQTCTFDQLGGTIGRNPGNDWVLPDPEQYVSGQHAQITFDHGAFYLTDKSSNGTFVNEPDFLIGSDNTVPLNHGDRLFVGDYELLVHIDALEAQAPDPLVSDPLSVPSAPLAPTPEALDPLAAFPDERMAPSFPEPVPADPVGPPSISAGAPSQDPMVALGDPDLIGGQPLEPAFPITDHAASDQSSMLDAHFAPPSTDQPLIPDDGWDETVLPNTPRAPPSPAAPPPPAPAAAPQPDEQDPFAPETASPMFAAEPPAAPPPTQAAPAPVPPPATMPPEPAAVPAPPRAPVATPTAGPAPRAPGAAAPAGPARGASTGAPASSEAAVHRLLLAAGVNPAGLPPAAANAVLELAGGALREVVKGLLEVLQARDGLKSTLRIARTTIQSDRNNPLKFSVSVDEALNKLVFPSQHGYMTPVDAIREAIEDMKAHQLAMVAGMRAALEGAMTTFEPDRLEGNFQKQLRHMPMAKVLGKAKYWELYEEFYNELSNESTIDVLALFGEEFATAYQDQLDNLG